MALARRSAQDASDGLPLLDHTPRGRAEVAVGIGYVAAQVYQPERVLICESPDSPGRMEGGGDGGESACTTTPFGDVSEVYAIYQAVNAAQTPAPGDTSYTEDVIQNPTVADRVVEASWYRINGAHVEILYSVVCPGRQYSAWFDVRPEATGFQPQIRAIQLVPALQAQVIRQLPTPIPRIGPADEDENGYAYVQPNATYFWVDQGPGQWAVVSGSTSAGGISVTVSAAPVRLVVDPGDGSEPVICNGTPPAVTRANYREDIPGCSHTYLNSSAMAPNGQTFPVTATVVWHATWSASTGEGGDLGYVSTTSAVRDLPVAEIQAVIVDQGGN